MPPLRLTLKIDVDTDCGMRIGVPKLGPDSLSKTNLANACRLYFGNLVMDSRAKMFRNKPTL